MMRLRTIFRSPAPMIALMVRASRIKGKLSWMSAIRMITASPHPPKYPERSPKVQPTHPATITVAIPTRSAIRAPKITRDRTSRPNWSVPNGCAWPGGRSTTANEAAVGLYGARDGASRAHATAAATIVSPTRPVRLCRSQRRRRRTPPPRAGGAAVLSIAHLRIQPEIGQVDEKVHRHVEERRDEHADHHDGKIPAQQGVQDVPAQSRPGEDRLGNDRPPQQLAGVQSEHGDDGDRRVFQHVADEHSRL